MNRDHFDVVVEGDSFSGDTDAALLEKTRFDIIWQYNDMCAGYDNMSFSRRAIGCYFIRHLR